jgi:hypothetical protein
MILHRGRIQLGRTRLALWSDDRAPAVLEPDALDRMYGSRAGLDEGAFPPVWRPVTWGERHYLISGRQTLHFCIAVAGAVEPRSQRVGRFYLREGDEKKPVGGGVPVEECKGPIPPLKVN